MNFAFFLDIILCVKKYFTMNFVEKKKLKMVEDGIWEEL